MNGDNRGDVIESVRRLSAVLMLLACTRRSPPPLVVGEDACESCRMTVTDLRFGGEVVLTTGRRYAFDSIECLSSFLAAESDASRLGSVWVSDFEERQLVDASSALFVQGGSLRSPMGRELVAFGPGRRHDEAPRTVRRYAVDLGRGA